MRRLVNFNLTTLDGYFDGQPADISWHHVDDEFNEFAIAQLKEIDTLLFGRVTYQLMASYWPTPAANTDDPIIAGLMNRMPKIVFSKTLDKANWNNTRLVKDHIAEEISKLKGKPGKDIAIFGSANLISSLMQMDLIDEHRVLVNPVILGKGRPLFQTDKKLDLNLLKTKVFGNGNVLLYYRPDGKLR